MGAIVEVKYFNSFVLKKTVKESDNTIIWNGSFGIPAAKGGYPVVVGSDTDGSTNWVIEEARIRGGYNNLSTDNGAKAYLVEEEPNAVRRGNSIIYSGIFNSRTGINKTNVFSVADDITKSADPANGTIQKLYAEDTNLTIFQELKVSRALVDKDAIYSAEGNAAITSSNLTIGVIQPYQGKYGISKNPESFAVYGYNKYFSDRNNNVIMRLSKSGLDEISRFGMIDYFRDELNNYRVNETVKGWTSFFDYNPDQMFSLRNNFYSITNESLYRHYATSVNRGNFYGVNYRSSVTFILNAESPVSSKNFKTIGYEGSSGWQLSTLVSDGTGDGLSPASGQWITTNDESALVLSLLEGEYAFNSSGIAIPRANYALAPGNNPPGFGNANPPVPRYYAGFNRKENRYVANLINNSNATTGEVLFGSEISGVKGFYVTGTVATDLTTNLGGEKQLFSVMSDYVMNNGY